MSSASHDTWLESEAARKTEAAPDPADMVAFADIVDERKIAEAGTLVSKHRDYGPYNIARAPGGPLVGLAVRLHDKVSRLAHLLESDVDPEHEALEDTLLDIANYGTIGQMVCRGEWPGVD